MPENRTKHAGKQNKHAGQNKTRMKLERNTKETRMKLERNTKETRMKLERNTLDTGQSYWLKQTRSSKQNILVQKTKQNAGY